MTAVILPNLRGLPNRTRRVSPRRRLKFEHECGMIQDMKADLRLFIAIELDATLRAALVRLEDALRETIDARAVRWVDPKNIHLTLKFLGNVNPARVGDMTAALERATIRVASHELTAIGLGAFPNCNRPNNIWVGLEGDVPTAALLARRIDAEFVREGFAPEERGLIPHLTLGRLKREVTSSQRAAVGRALQAIPTQSYGTVRVERVYLIASDLQPTGPVYRTLAQFPLESSHIT